MRGELANLRHACLAAIGWLNGQSILTKKQLTKTLADAARPYATGRTAMEQNVPEMCEQCKGWVWHRAKPCECYTPEVKDEAGTTDVCHTPPNTAEILEALHQAYDALGSDITGKVLAAKHTVLNVIAEMADDEPKKYPDGFVVPDKSKEVGTSTAQLRHQDWHTSLSPFFTELLDSLGWKGGTIHDALRCVRKMRCDLDSPIRCLQFPDGRVPENVAEAAAGWHNEYLKVCTKLSKITDAANVLRYSISGIEE